MAGVPRVLIVVAWTLALVLSQPAEGWSHAFLVRSAPRARAILAQTPERVQLWFNERLEPAYSHVSVWNHEAQRVDAGDTQVAPAQPTRLSVSVPPLPAGPYKVKYRVLSVDGHVAESEFTFTVRAAP